MGTTYQLLRIKISQFPVQRETWCILTDMMMGQRNKIQDIINLPIEGQRIMFI